MLSIFVIQYYHLQGIVFSSFHLLQEDQIQSKSHYKFCFKDLVYKIFLSKSKESTNWYADANKMIFKSQLHCGQSLMTCRLNSMNTFHTHPGWNMWFHRIIQISKHKFNCLQGTRPYTNMWYSPCRCHSRSVNVHSLSCCFDTDSMRSCQFVSIEHIFKLVQHHHCQY